MDNPIVTATAAEDISPTARFLAVVLYNFSTFLPFIPTYVHLIIAALLPIVAGSHASLKRPTNTLSPAQARKLRNGQESDEDLIEDEEDEDEEASAAPIENLTATDALMFPVTAGVLLGGLFLVIKFLNDPSILSRILTWYFSVMGVFAVGKAYADILGLGVSFVFPRRFRSADGKIYIAGYNSYKVKDGDHTVQNPLGRLRLLPKSLWGSVWKFRRTLGMKWNVVIKSKGLDKEIKKRFWIGDIVGVVTGLVVVGAYALGGKHWALTNIMGISFSYGAMQVFVPCFDLVQNPPNGLLTLSRQLISPTTFQTATLLLGALFFYDIFFVFYTPLMVTVATNLDVPIKLLFPRPGTTKDGKPALAMLGLGDIVIPGLVIAMSLRWDLWRFYETKRKANLLEVQKLAMEEIVDSDGHDIKRRKTYGEEEMALMTKPRYIKVTGIFGERFWKGVEGTMFGKEYFLSSIGGYILGMMATLMVMHVWKHAQPALLYLVPGVLGSIWGMAAWRGELSLMWNYTEEGDPIPESQGIGEKITEAKVNAEKAKVDEPKVDKEEDEEKPKEPEKEESKSEEVPKEGSEEEREEEEEEWISVAVTTKLAAGARRRKGKGKHMEVPASMSEEVSSSSSSSEAFSESSSLIAEEEN